MKQCPVCGELIGDSAEKCFNCWYDFKNDLDTFKKEFKLKEERRYQEELKKQQEMLKKKEDEKLQFIL